MSRVIPCLLLKDKGLVKTYKFDNPKYVGDPINTVKIFNEKEVDELIFLDITATVNQRKPDLELINAIAGETFMPICYGGGITKVEEIKEILYAGVEKVSLNAAAFEKPKIIENIRPKIIFFTNPDFIIIFLETYNIIKYIQQKI